MNLLDFFFPKRCVGCGRVGTYFCDQCRETIRVIKENEAVCPVCERLALDGKTHPACRTRYTPDGLTSFFHYDGVVRKAIKALKYRLVTDLASEFISLVPDESFNNAVLLPIPLHSSRYKERGFNQSEVLGSEIAEKLQISMRTDILMRTKKTDPQAGLKHRKDRLENMNGVFALQRTMNNELRTIILFDDVFTTGATMRAATAELKRHGAKNVWCITIAR